MNGQFARPRKRALAERLLRLLVLLLLLISLALGAGQSFHLRLQLNTERLSPTISGAEQRANLGLLDRIEALSIDEDVALADLFSAQSGLGKRLQAAGLMGQTVEELMDYLASYDANLGTDRSLLRGLHAVQQFFGTLRELTIGAGVIALVLLVLGLWRLLRSDTVGVSALLGTDALLVGGFPLLLLSLVRGAKDGLDGMMKVAARYGVGCSASLTLTGVGRAQVLLAFFALLSAAAACVCCAARKTRRPARAYQLTTNH